MHSGLRLFVIFIFLIVGLSAGDSNAPVLLWKSTTISPISPKLPALRATSNAQLKNVLDSIGSKALVMFIMNELNVEDFSGYPHAFKQLQKEIESAESILTPSMSDPAQVPALLTSYSQVTVDVDNLELLQMAAGLGNTLFLVYLKDKPGAEREKALSQSDVVISRVLARVRSLTTNYAGVLTGKRNSMGGKPSRRQTRSLKADAEDDATLSNFFSLDCIFIYTSTAPVMRFSTKYEELPVLLSLNASLINAKTSTCNTSTQVATVTWNNVQGPDGYSLDTVTLNYTFAGKLSQRESDPAFLSSWTLPNVTLVYNGTVDSKPVLQRHLQIDFAEVYAPKDFSYHCTSRKWTVQNINETSDMTSLELPGFQIQAFLEKGAKSFDRAWDCTPFFTIPIWSGLFLSLIMLLVLTWSLHMLASVPTPDRFDDPRGQPLHVPTTSE